MSLYDRLARDHPHKSHPHKKRVIFLSPILYTYLVLLHLCMGRIRLSTGSITMIALPPSFNRVGKGVSLCLRDVAKEIVWWTRLKEMTAETFLFDRALTIFFKFYMKRKLKVERKVLPSKSR